MSRLDLRLNVSLDVAPELRPIVSRSQSNSGVHFQFMVVLIHVTLRCEDSGLACVQPAGHVVNAAAEPETLVQERRFSIGRREREVLLLVCGGGFGKLMQLANHGIQVLLN